MRVDEAQVAAASRQWPAATTAILVISDVLLHREGVASGLAAQPGVEVVACGPAADALRLVRQHRPRAVLIDVPGPAALGLVPRLRSAAPDLVLVGFGIGDDDLELAGAEAGLTGFVGRDGTLADLAAAVHRALAGDLACSPRLAALMCRRLAELAARPAAGGGLSPREGQVARLVADGLSNKEIAQALAIGPATVKNHVHNILEKLALRRRSAIAAKLPAR
jgi:DNA-binding NarL/FixJ family response regulator